MWRLPLNMRLYQILLLCCQLSLNRTAGYITMSSTFRRECACLKCSPHNAWPIQCACLHHISAEYKLDQPFRKCYSAASFSGLQTQLYCSFWYDPWRGPFPTSTHSYHILSPHQTFGSCVLFIPKSVCTITAAMGSIPAMGIQLISVFFAASNFVEITRLSTEMYGHA